MLPLLVLLGLAGLGLGALVLTGSLDPLIEKLGEGFYDMMFLAGFGVFLAAILWGLAQLNNSRR